LDPAFGNVNTCIKRAGAEMDVSQTPLPPMPAELKELFEPAKEAVR
jgi:hypothetical protein